MSTRQVSPLYGKNSGGPTTGNWYVGEVLDKNGDLTHGVYSKDENGDLAAITYALPLTSALPELMANAYLLAASKDLLFALANLQANPNDPANHRLALDAMKKARGPGNPDSQEALAL